MSVARRPFRLGLRQRVVALFALGALALASSLAVLTNELGRRYLVRQRERTATRLAFSNASTVRSALVDPTTDARTALALADLSSGGRAVLERGGEWYGTSVGVGRDALPGAMRSAVAGGQAVRQRTRLVGSLYVVVGAPLPDVDAAYFEAFPLTELERTLSTLRLTSLAAAAFTTLAAASLGVWASRRVLRPVSAVSTAAGRIARGDLSARIDASDDPDLAPLVSSFNEMADAVRDRIEREERFVADVSHELRSPLTTLATGAELLSSARERLGERDRRALALVVGEVERFRALVEDLLELGRGDVGVAELDLQPVRVGELVLHSVTRRRRPVPVTIDASVATAQVLLDKRRVERVLANLLDNAETHGQGVAKVAALRVDGSLRLVVEDEGPGVPAGERERIFERFYRGSASGRRGDTTGSGLGLALVAEHVHLHGGSVHVEDRDATGGARFVVDLPWREPS